MSELLDLELLAKDYSKVHSKAKAAIATMEDELNAVKTRHMPGIKKIAVQLGEKEVEIRAEADKHPDLFVKPRSHVFFGIKVGMIKGKDKLEYDDSKTVLLIEKHLAEKAGMLIETIKKPVRKALDLLTPSDLKMIGVKKVFGDDRSFVKPEDSSAEKVISAVVKQAQNAG